MRRLSDGYPAGESVLSDGLLKQGSKAYIALTVSLCVLMMMAGAVFSPRNAQGAARYSWYLAEGYTAPGFQEYICIGNPGTTACGVEVTFLYNRTASKKTSVTVPARSRSTIHVNSAAGTGVEVSALLTSARNDLAVERAQYFIYGGEYIGSHVVRAARAPVTTWYFAEGYTGPGFDQYVCVLNTNASTAGLTFRFHTPAGEVVRTGTVPANRRATFKVNDLLGCGIESSLKLEADRPVVAERPVYFDYLGVGEHHWKGGHCVMGSPAPSTSFYFAEGTTRPGFEEWITIQNPNRFPITVMGNYQFGPGQGSCLTKSYTVNPCCRFTFFVPDEVGLDKDVSLRLYSSGRFLAERPLYYSFAHEPYAFSGGNCTIGAQAAASNHFLAEGHTGPYFEEWLCIQNPSSKTSTVSVEYLTQERGPLPPVTVAVRGNSRMTILVNEQAGPDLSLATAVRVKSGPSVVVERPIYVDDAGNPAGRGDADQPPAPAPDEPPIKPPDASGKPLHGFCFSPYLTSWSVTGSQIASLMDKMTPYCGWIRTFGSEGDWDLMPEMARARGLRMAAGAYIWSDLTANQKEVDQLVAQVRRGVVDVALVGDEMLENKALSEDQMVSYLRKVRATGVPTSTSQSYWAWPNTPRVVAECDFLTANIYPYWSEVSISKAIANLDSCYQQVKNVAQGKKVVVETGWPTAGPARGQAVASPENAARYLSEFVSWARANGVEYFYFEAFDESWKDEGGCGAHWGIWGTDGKMKPAYSSVLKP